MALDPIGFRVVKIDRSDQPARGSLNVGLSDADQVLIEKHASTILDVLWAVLPVDPAQWPYETEKLLVALEASDANNDERLAELRRRHRVR